MSFTGEYRHNLDAKGRLIIPARFRDQLGDEFTVTRSLDGCLAMYAAPEWQALEEKLNALPMTNEKARSLKRFLLGSAAICELDKQGRILLPAQLREIAGIEKNVVFVGMGTRGELWSEEAYNAYETETTAEEINSISEELLDSGFQI